MQVHHHAGGAGLFNKIKPADVCQTTTDLTCGLTSTVCSSEGCKGSCDKCSVLWQDVLSKYYGSGGDMPADWQGCFSWGVEWPCHDCLSPSNPDGAIPSATNGCSNVDSTPVCIDGYTPCGGVPKCYPTGSSKDGHCDPFQTKPVCSTTNGGGGGGGGGGSSGSGGDGTSTDTGGISGGDGGATDTSGDGPSARGDGSSDGSDSDTGSGSGTTTDDIVSPDTTAEKPAPVAIVPADFLEWPNKPCDDCASASFKCREASCENWECSWWCRCWTEGVDYTACPPDGEPCDCAALAADGTLYDVTYDELINSKYMDVIFTGPGAKELNDAAMAADVAAGTDFK